MGAQVLVAFATRHGSTREVADAVGARLRELGLAVEVRPAGAVEELDGYDSVVLGSALYVGRLHGDARRFLKAHRAALAERPFAVFAMGPATLDDADVAASRKQLDRALARVPEADPIAVAIFGGVVDPQRLPFPLSNMPASDARDWDGIEAWATELAATLRTSRSGVAARLGFRPAGAATQ